MVETMVVQLGANWEWTLVGQSAVTLGLNLADLKVDCLVDRKVAQTASQLVQSLAVVSVVGTVEMMAVMLVASTAEWMAARLAALLVYLLAGQMVVNLVP